MDNLDKIKFKQSIPGWLFKIDGSGETEFKEGKKFVEELQAWKDLGNKIEPQYTPEELEEKEAAELEAEKTAYIGLRQSEYPSIGDQLDYIYHNGIEAWKTDMIKPVKDKYPKPD
jgi:hypothetical protein